MAQREDQAGIARFVEDGGGGLSRDEWRPRLKRRRVAGLAMLGLALGARALWAGEAKRVDSIPDISINDLKTAIADKSVTLLDANGTEMYREGHIPGAINFEASADQIQQVLPKDKSALIVAY